MVSRFRAVEADITPRGCIIYLSGVTCCKTDLVVKYKISLTLMIYCNGSILAGPTNYIFSLLLIRTPRTLSPLLCSLVSVLSKRTQWDSVSTLPLSPPTTPGPGIFLKPKGTFQIQRRALLSSRSSISQSSLLCSMSSVNWYTAQSLLPIACR
jgi:hypothetical protein